jgi:hypothetical protein
LYTTSPSFSVGTHRHCSSSGCQRDAESESVDSDDRSPNERWSDHGDGKSSDFLASKTPSGCATIDLPWATLDMLDRQHPEDILASIVVAIKFCPCWEQWSLIQSLPGAGSHGIHEQILRWNNIAADGSDSGGALLSSQQQTLQLPTDVGDLERIPRSELPQLLQAFKKSIDVFDTSDGLLQSSYYNRVVRDMFSFMTRDGLSASKLETAEQLIAMQSQLNLTPESDDVVRARIGVYVNSEPFSALPALQNSWESVNKRMYFNPFTMKVTSSEQKYVRNTSDRSRWNGISGTSISRTDFVTNSGTTYLDCEGEESVRHSCRSALEVAPISRSQFLEYSPPVLYDDLVPNSVVPKSAVFNSAQLHDDPAFVGSQNTRTTQAYVAYPTPRSVKDELGIPDLRYTALIERCAKYLYMEPGLLHALVQQIDDMILSCATEYEEERLSRKRDLMAAYRNGKRTKSSLKRHKPYTKDGPYGSSVRPPNKDTVSRTMYALEKETRPIMKSYRGNRARLNNSETTTQLRSHQPHDSQKVKPFLQDNRILDKAAIAAQFPQFCELLNKPRVSKGISQGGRIHGSQPSNLGLSSDSDTDTADSSVDSDDGPALRVEAEAFKTEVEQSYDKMSYEDILE